MENLIIAAAQFENSSGNKEYNLQVIADLSLKASQQGAKVISFHECSVTGYTFARKLLKQELLEVAEPIPEGKSINRLIEIAGDCKISVLAGLFERGKDNEVYKSYVCVDENGVKASYRKLHPFINPHIRPGNSYVVFDLYGWKCGILICYDNNVIENVRATTLLGAEIIFMPHVTMCTPAPMPGRGFVDPTLWDKRVEDPVSLRLEFDGPKGRQWLMKWLPARAYDNGIYAVFTNPIGMDDDQLKNGNSLILDPFGDILAECRTLGNDFVTAVCTRDKLLKAGGFRYRMARKPELYSEIVSQPHDSVQKVVWMK